MSDITTTLYTAMHRAARNVLHDIAKVGVVSLKKVLDKAGFSKSEYLKNYQVFSHVYGEEVIFEILVDFDAIQADDDATKKALEDNQQKLESVDASYGVKSGRAYTAVRDGRKPAYDARTPAKDARTPAKDARKTSQDRLLGHEIALHAPRSARITREGKLSVTLQRSVRETKNQVHLPQGQFEGVMKDVMDKLSSILLDAFLPELQKIVDNYVG